MRSTLGETDTMIAQRLVLNLVEIASFALLSGAVALSFVALAPVR